MTCNRSDRLLEALMTTEVGEDERQELLRHAQSCESCGELQGLHQQLEGVSLPSPSEDDLLEVRRGVLRNIRTSRNLEPASRFLRWLELPMMKHAFSALATVAFLVIGFVAGRSGVSNAPLGTEAIAGSISAAAAANHRLAQSQRSPYAYSNVRLQQIDAETVRLDFDVATHLDLVRDKDDPLVAEVLVQSLVSPATVGTRLEAIGLVKNLEPKVRDALVVAMLEDPNLAVRLKAISKLTANGGDFETHNALLDVLRTENSVTMRLLAIDYLTNNNVSAEALRDAVKEGRPEPGTAVYARAEKYLRVF